MSQHVLDTVPTAATSCDPAARVTKTLLVYGVIAGPLYVAVSLTEALTRDGFDLARHPWSVLANGPYGWIHVLNLVAAGVLTGAAAVGLRRALRTGRGSRWAPRLVGAYAASLVGAGVFRADPVDAFPRGAQAPATMSWHSTLHFACGAVGFTCLAIACFVLARRFAVEHRKRWSGYSVATGVVFLAGFAAVATGGGSAAGNLAFTAAVVLVCSWTCAVCVHLYKRVAH
jgi:hypothetical membrane protein